MLPFFPGKIPVDERMFLCPQNDNASASHLIAVGKLVGCTDFVVLWAGVGSLKSNCSTVLARRLANALNF